MPQPEWPMSDDELARLDVRTITSRSTAWALAPDAVEDFQMPSMSRLMAVTSPVTRRLMATKTRSRATPTTPMSRIAESTWLRPGPL